MPNTTAAYKKTLRLSENTALIGVRKIFGDLFQQLAAKDPNDPDLAALIAGNLPDAERYRTQSDTDSTTSLLVDGPVEIALTAYRNYCDQLLTDFKAISQAYATDQTNPSWMGYFNRYFTNRAYPAYNLSASANQDFITVIDAICLIDTTGEWIQAFNRTLQDLLTFSFADQERVLAAIYTFFSEVQGAQEQFMATRCNAIIERLTAHYGAASTEETTYDPESFSAVPTDDIDLSALLPRFFQQQSTSEDKDYLNSQAKFAFDLELLHRQWQQEGETRKALLKNLKKKIHHLAQVLGIANRIANNPPEQPTPTLSWSSGYHVQPEGNSIVAFEKQHRRALQQRHWRIGTVGAAIIGVGEGLVAVTGLSEATSLPPLAIMLIVGLSGWYINYLLFKGDIRDCLDEFFIKNKVVDLAPQRRLFLDQAGKPLSCTQMMSISTLGLSCFFVGVVFAALSFVSSKEQWPKLIQDLQLAISLDPVSLSILAAIPAAFVGIGFVAIFFRAIVELIKNKQWQDIGTLVQSLRHPAAHEMTVRENMQHGWHAFLKITMMAAATAITGLVAYFSFPVFNQDCSDLFAIFGNANLVAPLAFTATLANTIVSIPFQIKAPYEIFNKLITTECTFVSLESNQPSANSAIQNINQRVQFLKIALAILTGLINAVGQGFLFMNDSSVALMSASISMAAAFSFFPNIRAAINEITRHHVHLIVSADSLSMPNLSVTRALASQRWIAMPPVAHERANSGVGNRQTAVPFAHERTDSSAGRPFDVESPHASPHRK